jgi:hypothetical protein
MIFVKINDTLYPAKISGRVADRDWDNRESASITLEMDYETAIGLFVDGLAWSIVERTEIDGETHDALYDNSEFNLAGDLTDHRDGTITVKMGKLTELEEAYEIMFGGNE